MRTKNGHNPERTSYPAHKMIPKKVMDWFRIFRKKNGYKTGVSVKEAKKMHTKKSRAFNKNIDNFDE